MGIFSHKKKIRMGIFPHKKKIRMGIFPHKKKIHYFLLLICAYILSGYLGLRIFYPSIFRSVPHTKTSNENLEYIRKKSLERNNIEDHILSIQKSIRFEIDSASTLNTKTLSNLFSSQSAKSSQQRFEHISTTGYLVNNADGKSLQSTNHDLVTVQLKHRTSSLILRNISLPSILTAGAVQPSSPSTANVVYTSTVIGSVVGNILDQTKLLCHTFKDRLGNLMFQYASILGLAYTLNRTAVFGDSKELDEVLKTPTVHPTQQKILNTLCKSALGVNEVKSGTFDENLTHLNPHFNYNIVGWLQSWRYFTKYEERIKQALTFSDSVRNKSSTTIDHLRKNSCGCTLIGVHIRKGDFTEVDHKKLGYTTASPEYLNKSFTFFKTRFPHSVFIIASDDLKWCKSNVPNGFQVIYLEGNDPAVDMSILSQLDHMVTTTGTFSWWCGYFNSGIVLYMKDFPVPNSFLASQFRHNGTDYFYPGWIAL